MLGAISGGFHSPEFSTLSAFSRREAIIDCGRCGALAITADEIRIEARERDHLEHLVVRDLGAAAETGVLFVTDMP